MLPVLWAAEQERRVLAQHQGYAVAAGADPHRLAGGAQHVQVGRPVPRHAHGQDVLLPCLHGQRDPAQLRDHLAHAVRAAAQIAADAVPGGQEPHQGVAVDGLHLAAQRGQRAAADAAQHVGRHPLLGCAAGPEGAAQQLAPLGQRLQRRQRVDAQPPAQLVGGERPVRPGVARGQPLQGPVDRVEEGGRQTGRDGGADGVPVERGVLGGDHPLPAGDPDGHRAPLADQLLRMRDVGRRHVAQPAQPVVVVVSRPPAGAAAELGLDLGDRVAVQQLAEVAGGEQLAEQGSVELQRLRTAFGDGCIALVHVGRDVVEQQRGGERRGALRLDLDQPHLTAADPL